MNQSNRPTLPSLNEVLSSGQSFPPVQITRASGCYAPLSGQAAQPVIDSQTDACQASSYRLPPLIYPLLPEYSVQLPSIPQLVGSGALPDVLQPRRTEISERNPRASPRRYPPGVPMELMDSLFPSDDEGDFDNR